MIYLIRHGETEWNKLGKMQGRSDSALTKKGIEQAQKIGERVKSLLLDNEKVVIRTSPLGRARSTAQIIKDIIGSRVSDFSVDDLLAELDVGLWSGLTKNEIDAKYPGEREKRINNRWKYIIEGGESYEMVFQRAKKWLESIPEKEITIAIAHEMISRTIQGAYANLDPTGTLEQNHAHGRIYKLHDGVVTFTE